MALISNNIEKVRAYELPCGIWSNGKTVGTPRIALIKWRSSWSDKFYQVYVNGQYAGATVEYQQRQLIVPVPTSLKTPVRIEVFAVEAEQAGIDFSSEIICPYSWSGRVRMIFVQSQSLPPGAIARIYYDNGTGTIDYTTNPSRPVDETYIVRIMNGAVEVATATFYPYEDNGYNYGS